MLYLLYPLNALLMVAMPIALAVWLARKTKAPWRLFGVGAATFVGSQVIHLPLNWGLTALFKAIWPFASAQPQWWHLPFNAIVLGLTAGLCEETARYVGYRWLAKKARSWRDALMLGAGHGGAEAIIFGLLAGLTFVNLAAARQMDLTAHGLSGETLALAQRQIAAYWGAPWYMALLGAVERVFAITIQVSLAVLVLQVFTRRDWRWLVVAIGYHLVVDGMAVVGVYSKWPPLAIEATLVPFALISLFIILRLHAPGEPLIPAEPEPILVSGASDTPRPASTRSADVSRQLDDSKFV
jgi:uncharacterized membrane protein YhfC